MTRLLGSIAPLATETTDVALGDLLATLFSDPLGALLILFGGAFVGLSVLAFGYLALGAVVDAVVPDFSSRGPPRRAE